MLEERSGLSPRFMEAKQRVPSQAPLCGRALSGALALASSGSSPLPVLGPIKLAAGADPSHDVVSSPSVN